MISKISFLLLSYILFNFSAQSQNNKWIVVAHSGAVLIDEKPIEDFSQVSDNQQVLVGDSSYVAFVSELGEYLELTEKGKFNLVQLAKQFSEEAVFNTQNLNILLDSSLAKEKWGVKTSILRCNCVGLISFCGNLETVWLFGEKWILSYKFKNHVKNEQVLVSTRTLFDDGFSQSKTKKNIIFGEWKDSWNESPQNSLFVEIAGNGKLNAVIRKVPKQRFPTLLRSLEMVENLNSPSAKLSLAIEYEANNFPIDAYFEYSELVAENPKVASYKVLFKQFKERQLFF